MAWTVEVIEVSRRITQEDMAEKPNRTARDPQRASPATVAKRAMRGAPELSTVSLHEKEESRTVYSLGVVLAVDVMGLLAFARCSVVGHRIVGDGGPDEKEGEDQGCKAHCDGLYFAREIGFRKLYFSTLPRAK